MGKPFRYELAWESNKNLAAFVEQVWKEELECFSVSGVCGKLAAKELAAFVVLGKLWQCSNGAAQN